MPRMSLLLIVFILLFADLGRAETLRVYSQAQDSYLVLALEDGQWHLDLFQQDSDGFPIRIQHQVYLTFTDAELAATRQGLQVQNFQGWETQQGSLPRQKNFLWEVTQAWSPDWEVRYSQWIRENATIDFFRRYQVPVDCADAAYAWRWIFARIHGLPAANRLTNGRLMSQDSASKQLSKLPQSSNWYEDRRFMKALDILLEATYTHTLMQDSYPIEISPDSLREGAHHLNLFGSTGHTMVFNKVNIGGGPEIPLGLIWATVPRDLSLLSEGGFWDGTNPQPGVTGILKMRWPVMSQGQWSLKGSEDHPSFSMEQFDPEFIGENGTFPLAVLHRIAPEFDPLLIYQNGRNQLVEGWLKRVQIVRDGFVTCQTTACQPGTPGYETWSTPSRDRRLLGLLQQIDQFVIDILSFSFEPYERWLQGLMDDTLEIEGQMVRLNLLRSLWYSESTSSDPREPIASRWGIEPLAFSDQLARKVSELLSERQRLIEDNPCAQGSCKPQSAEWLKWQSEAIDQKLQLKLLSLSSYCRSQTPLQCEQVRSQLELIPGPLADHSLYSVLLRSLFFHFDPNSQPTERWAQNSTYEKIDLISSLTVLAEDTAGRLALQDREGVRLLNSVGEVIHRFPSQERLVYLFPQSGTVLLGRAQGVYVLWTAEEGYSEEFSLSGEERSLGPQVFAVGPSLLVDVEGEIRRTGPFSPELVEHEFPIDDALFLFDEKRLYFLDLKRSPLGLTPISLNSSNPVFRTRVFAYRQTPSHLLVSLVMNDQSANLLMEKSSGQVVSFLPDCEQLWFTGEDGLLCQGSEDRASTKWLRHDSSFTITEELSMPGLPLQSQVGYLETYFSVDGGRVYWGDLRKWGGVLRPLTSLSSAFLGPGRDWSVILDVEEQKTLLVRNETGEFSVYPDFGWFLSKDGYEGLLLNHPVSALYEWMWPSQPSWPSHQGLLIPLVQGYRQLDPLTLDQVIGEGVYLPFQLPEPRLYNLKTPRLYPLHAEAHLLLFQGS